jgi:hypothetical protein
MIYVQIGTKPWHQEFALTSDCWYNVIIVINDKEAIVMEPFFDKNRQCSMQLLQAHKYFGITNTDILSVVAFFADFQDWDNIFDHDYYHDTRKYNVYPSRLLRVEKREFESPPGAQLITCLSNMYVNDGFDVVCFDNDTSKLYVWNNPSKGEIINGVLENTRTFPYYFIPFDLRGTQTWEDEYMKWRTNHQSESDRVSHG